MDIQVYSSSVKEVKQPGTEYLQSLPVFFEQDKIEGKVMLDPSRSQNGRLTITLEGSFGYASVKQNPDEYPHSPTVRKYRHVFLSSTGSISIPSSHDSLSAIREALTVRRRPSTLSNMISTPRRSCEFSFELPRGSLPGEAMPFTFSLKTHSGEPRRPSHMEELEVSYRVTATWEPSGGHEKPSIIEAPVLFQQDADFQSLDSRAAEPGVWLEMPLIPERPIPFVCAVTLPRPQSFSRYSSIPYFVVFSTNPRCPRLVKEIAADATIAVSLVRKITITPQRMTKFPTLPDTPPTSDDSDSQIPSLAPHSKFLKRSIGKTRTRPLIREEFTPTSSLSSFYKPLPKLPQADSFSVTRTLQTQMFIGFPKRPRVVDIEASRDLPEGLFKGQMALSKEMIPSVDWPGVSVKYYLEVSVLAGQDDVRARIPIKLY